MSTVAPSAEAGEHTPLRPLPALFVLMGLLVVLAGYLVAASLLGIKPVFAGLLVLFYWYSVKAGEPRSLPSALIGALGGVLNATLFGLPGIDPGLAALAGLVVVVIALYALLVGFWPILFNPSYMLVVTVATIPAILAKPDPLGMASAVVLSAVYFGLISWLMRMLRDRVDRRKAADATTHPQPG